MGKLRIILLAVLAVILVACSAESEPVDEVVTEVTSASTEEGPTEPEESKGSSTADADALTSDESPSELTEIEDEPDQPTPTVEPTPTIPQPTIDPVDEETRERASQAYTIFVMAQAAAELLNETAVRSQEGEFEDFEWFGTTIVIGVIRTAVAEAETEIEPPERLKSLAEDIFKLNSMVGDILGRWVNKEIYADDVIIELDPILLHLEDVISGAELVADEEYGVDASELSQIREEMLETIYAALDSSEEGGTLETSETQSTTQDVEVTAATIEVTDEYIEIQGVGPAVSENFELNTCYKTVFYISTTNEDFIAAQLHSLDEDNYDYLASGEDNIKQIELEGGSYFIEVDTSNGVEWRISGECQSTDEQLAEVSPAPEPMPELFLELEGTGPTVSDNFALGSCYKGVFFIKTANEDFIAAQLHSLDEDNYDYLASGEDNVKQIELEGGNYFVEVDTSSGVEWRIKGECGD